MRRSNNAPSRSVISRAVSTPALRDSSGSITKLSPDFRDIILPVFSSKLRIKLSAISRLALAILAAFKRACSATSLAAKSAPPALFMLRAFNISLFALRTCLVSPAAVLRGPVYNILSTAPLT